MGMIRHTTPDVDRLGRFESFASRFGSRVINNVRKYVDFVSSTATIAGGYTHVTCTFEQGTGGARTSRSRSSEPLSELLRRTICRAVSILYLSSRLSGLWRLVRHHRPSRSQSWFQSQKKCLCLSTNLTTTGREVLALLILPLMTRLAVMPKGAPC